MSEDNVSAGEALVALEKMDKIFKSFEAAKKAVKYLAGLEQNVRELEAQVAAHQETANHAKAASEDLLLQLEATQARRMAALDEEFETKRAQLEASCHAYQESVNSAVAASRTEHQELLAQIAQGHSTLGEQQRVVRVLREQAETLEARVVAARESAQKILEGKL